MKEIITNNLAGALNKEELLLVIRAFHTLMTARPDETRFSIKFFGGAECEVWCFIDNYPERLGGKTATILLPSDY